MIEPRLHHYCQNVTPGSLEKVIEMYTLLDLDVVYRPPKGTSWAMVGQKQLRFAIQISEVNEIPIADIDIKKRTHIAFISENPQKIVDAVREWARAKGFQFREGGWSPIERYFDLPDLFVDFVVEVMHTSIEKE